MKTIILSLFVSALAIQFGFAQCLDRLMSAVWKEENLYKEEDHDEGRFYRFDKKTRTFFRMEGGKVVNDKFRTPERFYLSNNIEKTFDESKVGKVVNGKYIVIKYRNVIIAEEDGETLRKALYDQIAGIEPTAKEKRQREREREKRLKNAEIIPLVYQIISLTANELILERVSPEYLIGGKIIRYIPYKDKIDW